AGPGFPRADPSAAAMIVMGSSVSAARVAAVHGQRRIRPSHPLHASGGDSRESTPPEEVSPRNERLLLREGALDQVDDAPVIRPRLAAEAMHLTVRQNQELLKIPLHAAA